MDEYNEESKTMIQVSHFYSKHGLDAHFMCSINAYNNEAYTLTRTEFVKVENTWTMKEDSRKFCFR